MPSFLRDIPFYVIRLCSLYVHYFPPSYTDSWRRSHLLPIILSSLAHDTPERVYAYIPNSEDIAQDGYQNVTYKQLLNAVDSAAWWLDQVFGDKGQGEVFSYIGPRDLRYGILTIAGIKTGRVIFLMSPHMPPSTQAILFSKVKCNTLLYDPSIKDRADESKAAIPNLKIFECPSQVSWLDISNNPAKSYVYEPSWNDAKDVIAAIFHTSGSTSIPKPVPYTNAAFVCCDSMYRVLAPSFVDKRMEGQKFYTMLPPMHTSGLTVALLIPLYRRTIYVCGPPIFTAPSPSSVNDIIRTARPDAALLSPYVMTTLLTSSPETRSNLLTIPSSAGFAGSNLPQSVGDIISQHLILRNGYGSTEAGPFPQFPYSRKSWEYLSFHDHLGVEFVPYNEETMNSQVYEMVIRPHDDPITRGDFQIIFHTLPHLLEADDKVYHTSDLWIPHPSIRGLWKWVGRTDDMISLSNGGKVFVSAVEAAIRGAFDDEMQTGTGKEKVKNVQIEVLVGGHQMSSPFLLIEYLSSIREKCRDDSEGDTRPSATNGGINHLSDLTTLHDLNVSLQRIVKEVNGMNTLSSKHTQIEEQKIICLDEKGEGLKFVRTEKGSVSRGKTFEKYETIISGLQGYVH